MQLRCLTAPMLANPIDHFPIGRSGGFVFEPKLDGFRCLAVVDSDRRVHLQSRRGARFDDTFPEVVWAACCWLPCSTWGSPRGPPYGRRPQDCA